MFRQILLTSCLKNVWRTVSGICIFISGFKRYKNYLRYLEESLLRVIFRNTADPPHKKWI